MLPFLNGYLSEKIGDIKWFITVIHDEQRILQPDRTTSHTHPTVVASGATFPL